MSTDYGNLYHKKRKAENELINACPNIDRNSGIYFLIRSDIGKKLAYIGKSVDLLERMTSHLLGYAQRIDISLKKRGFYSEHNPTGWKLNILHFPKNELDKWERHYIEKYRNAGYELYNVESGGTEGKTDIGDRKPTKTYRDGLAQGRKKLAEELSHIIKTHLFITLKKETKISQKAFAKFWELLKTESEDKE